MPLSRKSPERHFNRDNPALTLPSSASSPHSALRPDKMLELRTYRAQLCVCTHLATRERLSQNVSLSVRLIETQRQDLILSEDKNRFVELL
jgi:hypothetical protein